MKTLLVFFLFALNVLAQEPLRVVVMDTGLDLNDPRFSKVLCPTGHKDTTETGIKDHEGHGTHIAGIIKKIAGNSGYCLIIVKFYESPKNQHYMEAFKYAVSLNPDVINISGGGTERFDSEEILIRYHSNIKFIVAAGNNGQNNEKEPYYPGSYQFLNVEAVGNLDSNGIRVPSSNYGPTVKTWRNGVEVVSTLPNGYGRMTGTSQSTAIRTGEYIKERIR